MLLGGSEGQAVVGVVVGCQEGHRVDSLAEVVKLHFHAPFGLLVLYKTIRPNC